MLNPASSTLVRLKVVDFKRNCGGTHMSAWASYLLVHEINVRSPQLLKVQLCWKLSIVTLTYSGFYTITTLSLILLSKHILYFALKNQVSSPVATGFIFQEFRGLIGELKVPGRSHSLLPFSWLFFPLLLSILPLRKKASSSFCLINSVLAG